MPISLSFTEGSLNKQAAKQAAKEVTELFLELHNLSGNTVMGPGVTNHITFLPLDQSLSNGQPFVGAWIEARVPSFALTTAEQKKTFFSGAMDIVEKHGDGKIHRKDIHGSAIYAVDGTWILGGEVMTNDEIIAKISNS
ncbi:MAG: hypothetical protein ACI93R_002743 [Flavobacteriales bacterium]|jgi:hypothetical protein